MVECANLCDVISPPWLIQGLSDAWLALVSQSEPAPAHDCPAVEGEEARKTEEHSEVFDLSSWVFSSDVH